MDRFSPGKSRSGSGIGSRMGIGIGIGSGTAIDDVGGENDGTSGAIERKMKVSGDALYGVCACVDCGGRECDGDSGGCECDRD